MSFLDAALKLAEKGFHVFPIAENSKLPLIPDFPNRATTDVAQIKAWWTDPLLGTEKPYNVGISTTRFGRGSGIRALLVVDVDTKKNGFETLFTLEWAGREFPSTMYQTTPTNGQHIIYSTESPVGQGVNVLGRGVDTRGNGGYIVGAGSLIEGIAYEIKGETIAEAPQWLIEECGKAKEREVPETTTFEINRERAWTRAVFYLRHEAPSAREGDGGDQLTFSVAARVRDFGLEAPDALRALSENWNDRNSPPWDLDELKKKVDNAYLYGKNEPGIDAPERSFGVVKDDNQNPNEAGKKDHPFRELNKSFAFVLAGGGHHILWETKDPNGRFKLEHLSESSFHAKFAAEVMTISENKIKPVTELWMKDKLRRSYDGVCFKPAQSCPPEWYNLWRGFAVEPAKEVKHEALDAFLEHAHNNVCGGDPKLSRWLLGYFAHLVQKPWEKPLTALVFQGSKGVGKNALIDRVGYLLGHHYLLASDKRYLTGNFNGHLENCLLFALDEAFWSGDKAANGNLKSLITGSSHLIEHKGKETYTVDNCTRVCILGNEEWLVPASHDERRFAVFSVGEGRKQDRRFFRNMRVGMEQGGYRHLLRYLLDFDLTGIDVDEAPLTQALLDQKESTLDSFQQWWLLCLQEGQLLGCGFQGEWPVEEVSKDRFRDAYYAYCKERDVRERKVDSRGIGRALQKYAPGVDSARSRQEGPDRVPVYKLPDLETCRKGWERFIGHQVEWG